MAVMFQAGAARGVLDAACRRAGLDPTGAELLRVGSNAVYRLASAPVVVRVAGTGESSASAQRSVAVARWLEAEDFSAVRLVPGIEQPMTVAGRPVTFWENAQDREEYARVDELADLLRRLHRLRKPEALDLPYFDPFAKVRGSLTTMEGLGDEDRWFLSERAERLRKEYDRLDFVLPFGVIHGDANVGNAIRRRDGRAVLIDLDGFCLAPREWDLVLTSLYYERYGWHTRAEYESFVHHYGFELMDWPGYPILADLRELMMTLWLGRRITADERAAREFACRMHAIRTNGSRRDWQPF